MITAIKTQCEIKSASWRERCSFTAVGIWQCGLKEEPYGEPMMVCRKHANRLLRGSDWKEAFVAYPKEAK